MVRRKPKKDPKKDEDIEEEEKRPYDPMIDPDPKTGRRAFRNPEGITYY